MKFTADKMCIEQKGAASVWMHSHCGSSVANAEAQLSVGITFGVRLCIPLLRIQRPSRWTRQASVSGGDIARRARVCGCFASMLADDAEPSTAPPASGVEARAEAVLRQSRQIPFGFMACGSSVRADTRSLHVSVATAWLHQFGQHRGSYRRSRERRLRQSLEPASGLSWVPQPPAC